VNPTLSIAIPTYRRADRLAETLNAFLPQVAPHGVPVCISYTDDTDRTERVIEDFRRHYPFVTAATDSSAEKFDGAVVAVVGLAKTRYVWLFGDDDLPEPGAVDRVLRLLREDNWSLLVLNASSYDSTLASVVEERRIRIREDRTYAPGEHESLLHDTVSYATFLGGLVFEKSMWDSVDAARFLNTDYVHVAVLYRAVVGRRARLVTEPQLRIRLGGATWASRYFEVEFFNWPGTVWGLPTDSYSDACKAGVCQKRPISSLARLLATRAYGYYGREQFQKFIAPDRNIPAWRKIILRFPLMVPAPWLRQAFIVFRRTQALWGGAKADLSLYRLKHRG